MVARQRATQKTLDRYRGVEFDWTKTATCIHLGRSQMVNMGHKPPKIPKFTTAVGAKKALKKVGFDSVPELLDSMFKRIPPAMMLLGDLAVAPGSEGLDGIMICAGPRKVFGWREDEPKLVVLDVNLDELTGAWRL